MVLLRSFIPSLGLMLLAATQAAAQGVLIDKSEIRFVSRQMGVNVEGRFRKWKANIAFLPKGSTRASFRSRNFPRHPCAISAATSTRCWAR